MPPGRMNERSGARSVVEPVDLAFDPVDLRVGDGEPRAAGPLFRQAEIGLDVEQIVLDARQRRIERGVARGVQPHDAQRGVDLVERAVGCTRRSYFLRRSPEPSAVVPSSPVRV